ncbi:MAG: enoyl-CoA hydratase [Hyphomicrobiales bacterium]|nr:MAG: enoyl-CoA hydratase [Hyphomicrobiales bacterium]
MTPTVPSTDPHIVGRIEAPIGWLIIDNPVRRNAVSLSMWKAIPAVVKELDQHPDVRVIIIRGAGDAAFVAGADISEFAETRKDAASALAYEEANAAAYAALRHAVKPTIAMIKGFCMGGGMGLAVAADLRFAADDAVFSIPAARLGVGYPPDGIRDVVKLIGPSRAKDLFFTARRVHHEEALALGLVDRVIFALDLEAETRAVAETIAENAPLTHISAKAAIDAVAGDPAAADWEHVRAMTNICFDSADFAEGRTAFMEKRKPVFEGK